MNYEDVLRQDGFLVAPNKGTSMMPLLRQDKDLMEIAARPAGRLRRLDAVLYKRRNGDYVLHRIIKLTPEGYLIRGDNTYALEPVAEEQVIGVLRGVVRDGRRIGTDEAGYGLYVRLNEISYPIRALFVKTRRVLSKIKRKLTH